MAANMWKNSLKNLITIKFYMKPYSIFFLQQNVTYFLNKPRIFKQYHKATCFDRQMGHHQASINESKILVHEQLLCQRDPVLFIY
jgi:hypothetical protein